MAATIDEMIDELTQYCAADFSRDCNSCKLMAKFDKEVDELTDTLGCEWQKLGDCNIRKCYDWLKEIQNETSANDVVNHPTHYSKGKIECIDCIKSATVGKSGIEAFCVGNAIKYLFRYEEKNGLEDVKKAKWYIERLIKEVEINETN